MRIRHILGKAAVLAMGCAIATPGIAQTGTVVMRRPLPNDARTAAANPATPTTPTTPTTPNTNDDPPPTYDTTNRITDDPVTDDPRDVCDKGNGAPSPIVTKVAWVLQGYIDGPDENDDGCVTKKPVYVCQTTFACQVGGRNEAFTSVAPDSFCENHEGEVEYPETPISGM